MDQSISREKDSRKSSVKGANEADTSLLILNLPRLQNLVKCGLRLSFLEAL